MENKIFGKVTFDTGFKTKITVTIFGKTQSIVVKIKAYQENDGITAEQEESFLKFQQHILESIGQVEGGLLSKFADASERFTITMILINRQGELSFLFDDKNDKEDGIVVQIYPQYLIESQDDYL